MVNLSEVPEPRFLIVMRPLWIVSATMLDIACARLQSIVISLTGGALRIVKDVVTVAAYLDTWRADEVRALTRR